MQTDTYQKGGCRYDQKCLMKDDSLVLGVSVFADIVEDICLTV